MTRKSVSFAVLGLTIVALLAVAATGCSSADRSLSAGDSSVRVLLTDAPSDIIADAEVTISAVLLVPGSGEDDSDAVALLGPGDGPRVFDLMDLHNGLSALLAERIVPAGNYSQLRLIVDQASVTLVDGTTFRDGSSTRELTVPSGAQTGIKVRLDEPIEADEDMVTIVVVDFDVDNSFVLQGNPDTPSGLQGVSFTPVLREFSRSEEPM